MGKFKCVTFLCVFLCTPCAHLTVKLSLHRITTYMDKLHSMELFLLEELENCEGTYEDLDLLSLATDTPEANTPTSSPSKSKDIEREWEISLYDVQFHKRSEL